MTWDRQGLAPLEFMLQVECCYKNFDKQLHVLLSFSNAMQFN